MFKPIIKVERGTKRFESLLTSLKKIDGQRVDIGLFHQQGLHYSGLSYPDLMNIHEWGTEFIPPRPVFRTASANLRRDVFTGRKKPPMSVRKGFKVWKSMLDKKANPLPFLNALGELGVKELRDVMGNPNFLVVTDNPTPLVWSGDLEKHITYRTSFDNRVRRS